MVAKNIDIAIFFFVFSLSKINNTGTDNKVEYKLALELLNIKIIKKEPVRIKSKYFVFNFEEIVIFHIPNKNMYMDIIPNTTEFEPTVECKNGN